MTTTKRKTKLETKNEEILIEIEQEKERKTRQEIKEEDNPLLIRANHTWPAMYEIYRESGQVPGVVKGMYTSHALAANAIAAYIG